MLLAGHSALACGCVFLPAALKGSTAAGEPHFCDAAVMTADIGVRMHEPGVCNGIARYCEYLSCLSVPLLVVPNKPTWANGMELHAVLRALWVVLYMDGQMRFSAPSKKENWSIGS